jgi:hypothetical protein
MTPQEALHEVSTMVFRNTDNFEMTISKDCYKTIVNTLELQIPKKPTFVDTRFRNHGRSIADGCSISKCYKCPNPNCMSHIFHVWDSEKYCVHCGQALDWGIDNA